MWYLQVENLTKVYVDKPIVDQLSFSLLQGQKVALVAKNGWGKTTLLKLIMGELDKTDGKVEFRKGIKIWYVAQDFQWDVQMSVLDYLFSSSHPAAALIKEYEFLLQSAQQEHERLAAVVLEMEEAEVWDYEAKVQMIITRLELQPLLEQSLDTLSGGELRRIALARALIDEPEFLILDEPTNHLDLQMIEWLENYLKTQVSTLFMITHDRYFLESVCNQIYELDRGKLYTYPGNYSYFLQKQAERKENELIETEKMRQLLKRELAWMRKAPRARGTKQRYREQEFYKLEERYDTQKELLSAEATVLSLPMQQRRLGTKILKIKNLSKRFWDKCILDHFSYEFKHGERVGIIGKNGVWKSTFIQMLLGVEEADSGWSEQGKTVVFGYYQQGEVDFGEGKRIIDVVKEAGAYLSLANGEQLSASQLLERFLFPVHQQYRFAQHLSGGEKRRLYLLTILMKNPNFLILDEPTNDLDLLTLRVLEDFLMQFSGCLLIVSHDRSFMDRLVDHLLIFEWAGKVSDFWGTYSEWKLHQEEKNKKSDLSWSGKPPLQGNPEMQGYPDNGDHDTHFLAGGGSDTVRTQLSSKDKAELDRLAKELEELEQEKWEISQIFDNKDLPYDEIALLSEHLGQLVKQIAQKEARWFELMEKSG